MSDEWNSVINEREAQSAQSGLSTQTQVQSNSLLMCHGCYNEFQLPGPVEFPVSCPRCGSDFCEIIDGQTDDPRYMRSSDSDDDEYEEDDDSANTFLYNPLDTSSQDIRTRSDRERANTDSMMQMVNLLSTIMNRGAGSTGASIHGQSGTETTTEQPPPRSYGFTINLNRPPRERSEPVQTDPNATPMEQLANFLQQTFAGIGIEPIGNGQNGRTTSPQDMVNELVGRMFNMPGNPSDYVYSNRHLDEIITQLMEQDEGSHAPPPAEENDIDTLPAQQITPDLLEHSSECAICKDQYELGQEVLILPCQHMFHPDCIKNWLRISGSCPNCRHHISSKTAQPPKREDDLVEQNQEPVD
ncbi:hypothetical protein V1512DRAFT_252051 [Lipomyces arxii]|uniref:uncharacterized protein n=1 Tax=Lipomyces arxii TaxID=56418 RepID=UPI0034CF097E